MDALGNRRFSQLVIESCQRQLAALRQLKIGNVIDGELAIDRKSKCCCLGTVICFRVDSNRKVDQISECV